MGALREKAGLDIKPEVTGMETTCQQCGPSRSNRLDMAKDESELEQIARKILRSKMRRGEKNVSGKQTASLECWNQDKDGKTGEEILQIARQWWGGTSLIPALGRQRGESL